MSINLRDSTQIILYYKQNSGALQFNFIKISMSLSTSHQPQVKQTAITLEKVLKFLDPNTCKIPSKLKKIDCCKDDQMKFYQKIYENHSDFLQKITTIKQASIYFEIYSGLSYKFSQCKGLQKVPACLSLLKDFKENMKQIFKYVFPQAIYKENFDLLLKIATIKQTSISFELDSDLSYASQCKSMQKVPAFLSLLKDVKKNMKQIFEYVFTCAFYEIFLEKSFRLQSLLHQQKFQKIFLKGKLREKQFKEALSSLVQQSRYSIISVKNKVAQVHCDEFNKYISEDDESFDQIYNQYRTSTSKQSFFMIVCPQNNKKLQLQFSDKFQLVQEFQKTFFVNEESNDFEQPLKMQNVNQKIKKQKQQIITSTYNTTIFDQYIQQQAKISRNQPKIKISFIARESFDLISQNCPQQIVEPHLSKLNQDGKEQQLDKFLQRISDECVKDRRPFIFNLMKQFSKCDQLVTIIANRFLDVIDFKELYINFLSLYQSKYSHRNLIMIAQFRNKSMIISDVRSLQFILKYPYQKQYESCKNSNIYDKLKRQQYQNFKLPQQNQCFYLHFVYFKNREQEQNDNLFNLRQNIQKSIKNMTKFKQISNQCMIFQGNLQLKIYEPAKSIDQNIINIIKVPNEPIIKTDLEYEEEQQCLNETFRKRNLNCNTQETKPIDIPKRKNYDTFIRQLKQSKQVQKKQFQQKLPVTLRYLIQFSNFPNIKTILFEEFNLILKKQYKNLQIKVIDYDLNKEIINFSCHRKKKLLKVKCSMKSLFNKYARQYKETVYTSYQLLHFLIQNQFLQFLKKMKLIESISILSILNKEPDCIENFVYYYQNLKSIEKYVPKFRQQPYIFPFHAYVCTIATPLMYLRENYPKELLKIFQIQKEVIRGHLWQLIFDRHRHQKQEMNLIINIKQQHPKRYKQFQYFINKHNKKNPSQQIKKSLENYWSYIFQRVLVRFINYILGYKELIHKGGYDLTQVFNIFFERKYHAIEILIESPSNQIAQIIRKQMFLHFKTFQQEKKLKIKPFFTILTRIWQNQKLVDHAGRLIDVDYEWLPENTGAQKIRKFGYNLHDLFYYVNILVPESVSQTNYLWETAEEFTDKINKVMKANKISFIHKMCAYNCQTIHHQI